MNRPLSPRVVVGIVYVIAMFMVSMDATIVNVALVTISEELQAPASHMGTINVGYLVSLALCLPVSGWLGDRFGTKRVFLLALGTFTLASVLCGIAGNLTELNLARMLQGAAGGLLTPVGMAILFRTFPAHERPRISRILIIPIALAPAMGPVIGGFLVEAISWRWAFYVNLPFGCFALLFGLVFLKEHKADSLRRLDWRGLLLSTPGFAMLMYALTQGSVRGWDTPAIAVTGLSGVLLLILFVTIELRTKQPMLEVRLFSDRLFRTMGLNAFFVSAGLLGMLYVFPLMYQDAFDASALEAGLTTFPEALGLMVSSQFVPWFLKRLGPRRMVSIALLSAIVMFLLLSLVQQDTNPWLIRMLLFCTGFFLGNAVGVIQATAFTGIPPVSMGQASTLFQVQNRLGSALGVAILSSIIAGFGTNASGGEAFSYKLALLVSTGFLLVALLFARRIHDTDAAAVLRKPEPAKKMTA
ncbi:MFS transporter [Paenibacillus sambharensis]|uniref:MFS transporter n=1 Tax=Paenibacillus sambharensis TaxID=1803190 RepID=A0A2W1LA05_9BACL|nr:MDR family MFS transporter [Paenibacillus sambharensis]PZD95723.1 MFS transporter [Paenibacillus sambharensis]